VFIYIHLQVVRCMLELLEKSQKDDGVLTETTICWINVFGKQFKSMGGKILDIK